MSSDDYFFLSPEDTDPARIKKEREKAKKLKKTQWWQNQLNQGVCHYCEKSFSAQQLTMDHVVPLARGGTSSKGNIVPCCRECNQKKKLGIPAEDLLKNIQDE
ncbi:MAG: HNH endonuclease [Bdellovibrionaceae bacterium]|nr:HNH endonuclease [Pseudobdellovibrionaceae bacterium]|tara:strand:- start:52 stop:360 length:309 start_codon:yes stop_codon:yes gene_type:complete